MKTSDIKIGETYAVQVQSGAEPGRGSFALAVVLAVGLPSFGRSLGRLEPYEGEPVKFTGYSRSTNGRSDTVVLRLAESQRTAAEGSLMYAVARDVSHPAAVEIAARERYAADVAEAQAVKARAKQATEQLRRILYPLGGEHVTSFLPFDPSSRSVEVRLSLSAAEQLAEAFAELHALAAADKPLDEIVGEGVARTLEREG